MCIHYCVTVCVSVVEGNMKTEVMNTLKLSKEDASVCSKWR